MDESFVLLQPTDADDMPPNEYPSTYAQRHANQQFNLPSIPWQDVEFHLFEPFSRITQASFSALEYYFNLSPKTPFSHKDAAYDARRVELAHQAQKMIKTSSREFPRSRSSTEEDVWNSELRGINDEEPTPDSEDSEDPFVELNTTLGAFEVLFEPQTPITRNNWERYFDEYVPEHAQDWGLSEPESRLSGVLIKDRDWIQKRVFWRGLDISIRPQVWLFLLGVYPMDSSESSRSELRLAKSKEYKAEKKRWHTDSKTKNAALEDLIHMIDKDVTRTEQKLDFYIQKPDGPKNQQKLRDMLITYCWCQDRSMSYVQGMNDLASLILQVHLGKEVAAYWTFVAFMGLVRDNFKRDGSGIKNHLESLSHLLQTLDPGLSAHLTATESTHLFYTYRWFLVCFRREFSSVEVPLLWDSLISQYQNSARDWLSYFACGILIDHRDTIVRHLLTFDEVFQYVQELSTNLRVHETVLNGYKTWVRSGKFESSREN